MESHHCEQKEKFKLAQIRIASLERNLKVIESRDTQIQRKYEELKTEFQNLKKNILTVGSGEVTRMCTDTSAAAGSASASCTSSTALAPVSMSSSPEPFSVNMATRSHGFSGPQSSSGPSTSSCAVAVPSASGIKQRRTITARPSSTRGPVPITPGMDTVAMYSPKFRCQLCSIKFVNLCQLRQHTEVIHYKVDLTLKGIIGCSFCGQTFRSRPDYRRHYSMLHNEERKRLKRTVSLRRAELNGRSQKRKKLEQRNTAEAQRCLVTGQHEADRGEGIQNGAGTMMTIKRSIWAFGSALWNQFAELLK